MIQFFWKCVVRVVMDIYVKSLEHLGSWIMMVRDQFFLNIKISLYRGFDHILLQKFVFFFLYFCQFLNVLPEKLDIHIIS